MIEPAVIASALPELVNSDLVKFAAAAARWNISGPAIAAVALLDLDGWHFTHFSQGGWGVWKRADRPNLMLPEIWVDQVGSVGNNLDTRVIRPHSIPSGNLSALSAARSKTPRATG